jgi:two-component system alkaline phosphatase synthesis response regulator PhoP
MAAKAKIMVVEDNIDEAKLIKMTLEPEGYEVTTSMNGNEAREKIGKENIDLIILDVMMPEMDGFAFLKWLREKSEFNEIPVILLSAVAQHIYDSKYPLKGVMSADADEFFEKPLKPEVLLDTIPKMLRK